MSPLYLWNGKLLVVDGALAAGQNCCCPTPEPEPEPIPMPEAELDSQNIDNTIKDNTND